METPIKVNYQSTTKKYQANIFLQEIKKHDIIACDFEVAVRYSEEELDEARLNLDYTSSKREWQQLNSMINATALDHPSHTILTHCSIATSNDTGYVFILDNEQITKHILNFLVTTKQRQIWHNANFDFKHIYYYTNKFPLLYEDTQILSKTILNHADNQQSLTGLKHLVGHKYGAWGISEDNFTTKRMYDEHVLQYAATDACATYYLWNSIQTYIEKQNEL